MRHDDPKTMTPPDVSLGLPGEAAGIPSKDERAGKGTTWESWCCALEPILVGGDWNMTFMFHIFGSSLSQLTFIFFRGIETTNQICSNQLGRAICSKLGIKMIQSVLNVSFQLGLNRSQQSAAPRTGRSLAHAAASTLQVPSLMTNSVLWKMVK